MSKELIQRTQKFAIRIIKMVQSLPQKNMVAYVLGKQAIRSGTSVGAYYRSSLRARSSKDFLSKITIAEEEADETIYWLELIVEAGLISQNKMQLLIKEAQELTAILTTTGKTIKLKLK
ncbi:MAG: four helix bundle protein [Chitinophagaceae bacterium]